MAYYAKQQRELGVDLRAPLLFTQYPYWIDRPKVPRTVLNLNYWYPDFPGADPTRKKLIRKAKRLFDTLNPDIWVQLTVFVKSCVKPIPGDEAKAHQKLRALISDERDNLFAYSKNLSAYTEEDGLQCIMPNLSDDDLDGTAYLKGDSQALLKVEDRIIASKPVAITDVSADSNLVKRAAGSTLAFWKTEPGYRKRIKRRELAAQDAMDDEGDTEFAALQLDDEQPVEQPVEQLAIGPPVTEFAALSVQEYEPAKPQAFAAPVVSAEFTASPDYVFSILGSNKTEIAGIAADKMRRLVASDAFDDFVCDLKSEAIRLTQTPSPSYVSFDQRDSMMQWMAWSCNAKDVSLTASETAVTSIQVTLQNGIVFDTASAAEALNEDSSQVGIKSPGLPEGFQNSLMVLGLSKKSAALSWSLSDIQKFLTDMGANSGTSKGDTLLQPLVGALFGDLKWTIDLQDLAGKRNTMWFSPVSHHRSVVRLAFGPDKSDRSSLVSFLSSFWPSNSVTLRLRDYGLVCSREVSMGGNDASSTTFVSTSKLCLFATVDATVVDGSGISVELQLATELTSDGIISLTVQSNKDNDFIAFAEAVVKKLSGADSISSESLVPPKIKEAFKFREFRLAVDQDKTLMSASISIEVQTSLGKNGGSDSKNVALYFEAEYDKETLGYGLSLSGSLWFPGMTTGEPPDRYFPDWEKWIAMQPLTPNAATSLALTTFLPEGVNTDRLPESMRQLALTEADFTLSSESIEVATTISSVINYTTDPKLPPLSFNSLSVDGFHDWNNKDTIVDLEFRIDLPTPPGTFSPTPTSTNQLIGAFHYESADPTQAAE